MGFLSQAELLEEWSALTDPSAPVVLFQKSAEEPVDSGARLGEEMPPPDLGLLPAPEGQGFYAFNRDSIENGAS